MSAVRPVGLLDFDHHPDLPYVDVPDLRDFRPPSAPGASKYCSPLGRNIELQSLLLTQPSDVLLVSFHGALSQSKTPVMPKFERLRLFRSMPHSAIFFGDPTLSIDKSLSLCWYTGWLELPLTDILADCVQRAAAAVGATKVVFVGSSGGGFASLQASARVPGSLALVMSPQTAISSYMPNGALGYARSFVQHVMPHLTPAAGVRSLSAVELYRRPQPNLVLYVQNRNDLSHMEDHYRPFRAAVEETDPFGDRVRFVEYDGIQGHGAPDRATFDSVFADALQWVGATQIEAPSTEG